MLEAVEITVCNNDMYFNENKQIIKYLSNFSKINIFVGANNCGKSRMMRLLFDSNGTKILSNDYDLAEESRFKQYKNYILDYLRDLNNLKQFFNIEKLEEMSDLYFFLLVEEKIKEIENIEKIKRYI